MVGKQHPAERIEANEAIKLFDFATIESMYRCMDLYKAYRGTKEVRNPILWDNLDSWDLMRVLSLCYDAGRVQGIREERAKKTSKQ